jgi:hypothetical protein
MLSISTAVGVGFMAALIAAGVGIPAAGAVGIKRKSPGHFVSNALKGRVGLRIAHK